jgi:hypothetical protein
MTSIIGLCGKKGSGKNTLCNFLHGYQLKSSGVINDFYLNEKGGLVVNSAVQDENGETSNVDMLIDVTRTDMDFANWAVYYMWPFIKHYAFASSLKEICEQLFDVPKECLHGTDEQKNQIVPHLLWENMPGVITQKPIDLAWSLTEGYTEQKNEVEMIAGRLGPYYEKVKGIVYHQPGPMTAREFMQFFGTEIMRKMYEPIWVNRTIKNILTEDSAISVISDCRFDNEAIALKEQGAKLVLLTRSISNKDGHASENGFKDFTDFDLVIDNANLSVLDTCSQLIEGIKDWGWIATPKPKEAGVKKIK